MARVSPSPPNSFRALSLWRPYWDSFQIDSERNSSTIPVGVWRFGQPISWSSFLIPSKLLYFWPHSGNSSGGAGVTALDSCPGSRARVTPRGETLGHAPRLAQSTTTRRLTAALVSYGDSISPSLATMPTAINPQMLISGGDSISSRTQIVLQLRWEIPSRSPLYL